MLPAILPTRTAAAVIGFLLLAAPAVAQVGYDRPGADYASVPLRIADPALCAARCERDPHCRAWGVRGTGVIEPRTGVIEFGFDRYGGDPRHLDVAADPNGRSCQAACEGEGACRAWTYVRPGYVGPSAVCYLKGRITRPIRRP